MSTIQTARPTEWLAARLRAGAAPLANAWRARMGDPTIEHLSDVIVAIADVLSGADGDPLAENGAAMQRALALALVRYRERAPIRQVSLDYHILAELLEEYLVEQTTYRESHVTMPEALQTLRSLSRAIRVVQQHALDAFAAAYTDHLEQQAEQILRLNRIVAHEMRQPLGVLQLMQGVLPIREGDIELTRLMDVFDRNVRRLAEVAARLERLSHDVDRSVMFTEQRVDLNELVAKVVSRLGDKARERDVRLQIDAELPVLQIDRERAELVFTNLIGNAIRYADASKSARLVEIMTDRRHGWPGVVVRDNGIGIRARRARHFFREFSRAHGYRDWDQDHEGLGLGLSIVRDCMDATGGTVHLDSTEGVGTKVSLSWPKRDIGGVR